MNLSIGELQQIVGGRLRLGEMPPRDGECSAIGSIVTDSRAIKTGDVFWALRGANHDGSHFAEEALTRGASGVVTSGRWVAPWAGRWSLEVNDSHLALCLLADWSCTRFSGRLITLEEALGKSITAAIVAAVLDTRFVGATVGADCNTSGALGLAAELVGLRSHNDYALVELPCPDSCHLSAVKRVAIPDIAVFLHSGAMPAIAPGPTPPDEAVMERLCAAVQAGVTMVVNGDDQHLRRAAQGFDNVIFCGRAADADVAADTIQYDRGHLRFSVAGRRHSVPARGRHYLMPALGAVAVGRLYGLSDAEIRDGLASFDPHDRCSVSHAGDVTIIDDTGHGISAATYAAIELLGESGMHGRRLVLCGQDAGLGENANTAFAEHAITSAGADLLVACGPAADKIVEQAHQAGMPRSNSIVCETPDQVAREVLSLLQPGDTVLLRGRPMAEVKRAIEQRAKSSFRRAA